jgi:peptidoglycan hydrolase-like protein with peptidoglycan-binding domain
MRILHPLKVACIGLLIFWIGGCGLNPQNVDRDLTATLPEVKTTIFSEAVRGLGRMNIIYGRGELRVMAKPIVDQTGTSLPTQGEIPQDISEMVKSTLNGIGGNILYVPYDPEFMLNTAQTGYSQWGEKLLPNIVLVGGLTEFDRGLVTKEKNLNLSGTAEELGVPMGLDFEDTSKSSLASITLDFNLIDFNTFTGIPFMQAVNNIKVHKTLKEDNLGFTVYGQTLGLRGQIKKVEGRHAAIRLVVQLGVIQVLGKYQKLPYWRLLPNAEPDPVVLDAVREEFYSLGQTDRIAKIQEYLYVYGKDVEVTGRLDAKTQAAIEEFKTERGLRSAAPISEEVYLALFENLPLDFQAQARRKLVDSMLAAYQKGLKVAAREEATTPRVQEPTYPPKPAAKAELGEVKLWLSKQAFKIGEPMEIFFEVTRPMFVRIVTINSAGQLSTLFPNPYQNDNYVRPGKTYRIPPTGSPVSLTVGAPEGTDKIRVIASLEPISADTLPLDEKGEFVAGASQKFALAGAEFQVLPASQSQAALTPGVAP